MSAASGGASGGAEPILLGRGALTPEAVERVACRGARVALAPEAAARVAAAHAQLESIAQGGREVYGLTTGFGALEGAPIAPADRELHQRNLLRSHAAGVGEPMSRAEVRALMLARASALARGRSGIRLEALTAWLALLEGDVFPVVPRRGSVGASDMAPLAHAALVLVGEGSAFATDGQRISGAEALRRAGLVPLAPRGRDAFALVNGLAQTAGLGALAVCEAARTLEAAELAAAMTLVAGGVRPDFLDERLAQARPHAGVLASTGQLRRWLGVPARPEEAAAPWVTTSLLRAPLALRCAPQVHGAARAALAQAVEAVTVELNAAVDNPTLFPDGFLSSTSGNPHGQPLAEPLEALATAISSLAVMSERRTARLLDPVASGGLTPFLVHPSAQPGLSSGLMIAQYTAAALVAELRTRSVPASLQSLPTSNGTEDHNAMSALSAERVTWAVRTVQLVVAIELLAAAQALDVRAALRGEAAPGAWLPPPLAAAQAALRTRVPVWIADRVLADDIAAAGTLVTSGELVSALPAPQAPPGEATAPR